MAAGTHCSYKTRLEPNSISNDRFYSKDTVLTVNLSSLFLNKSDISLLEKGLTFIPTPKTLPIRSVLENKDRLIRNIKIKSFFQNSSKPFEQKLNYFKRDLIGHLN